MAFSDLMSWMHFSARAARGLVTLLCLSAFLWAGDARADAQGATPPAAAAAIADARKLGQAFSSVAERVSPSVVQIEVVCSGEVASALGWSRPGGVKRGLGSGIIFSSDGAILTNNHVVEEARALSVRLRDGRIFAGRIAGRDPATDLAVVRIDATNLPAATFADSDAAQVGEWVLAIGSPFGLSYSVTTGALSAKGRGGLGVNAVEDYLQTDASINPGNSGGPLVDLNGQVLGVSTMVANRAQGIGLAVPSRIARRVAEQLLKKGRVQRAWLGIEVQDVTPQLSAELAGAPPRGALVNAVVANSPAAQAGLANGDVVVALSGKPIVDAQDVLRELFLREPGDPLTIDLVHQGKRTTVTAKLVSRGDPPPAPTPMDQRPSVSPGLGISVRDLGGSCDGAAATQRTAVAATMTIAQIAQVLRGSPADRAGLSAGDDITEVDGKLCPTSADVQAAARDGHVLLRVRRGAASFYAAVR